jgi:hypothetical protein
MDLKEQKNYFMINTIYMEHSVSQPDKSLLQILVPLREEEIKRKIQ